jgi:hypothetical protein
MKRFGWVAHCPRKGIFGQVAPNPFNGEGFEA